MRLQHYVVILVIPGGLMFAGATAHAQQPQVLDSTGSTAPPPKRVIPREGCVTSECHPGVIDYPYLHGPIQVRGCEGCHELVDPIEHRYEYLAAREQMCDLCHIPEISDAPYTHEPFAQGECLTCHNPHGGAGHRLLRGERYVDACLSCHQDMTGNHDVVHGPASVGACGACHEPHNSQRPKLLNTEGRDLCLKCHIRTNLEIESLPVVHAPVLDDCRACHDPHAADSSSLLVDVPENLCTECHRHIADTISNSSAQHAAVTASRTCLNCHTPHASNHAGLLQNEAKTLCFECHNKAIPTSDGGHLINMEQLIEAGKSLHGAATERGCIECHDIHGGGHRRLLTNEYPSSMYYPFAELGYALCFSCHDRQLVLLEQTDSATRFRNGTTNLHYVHVNRDTKGRSCNICHDAHAASPEGYIRDSVPFGPSGWMLPIQYKGNTNGGQCAAGCHIVYKYNRIDPEVYPLPAPDNLWNGGDLDPDAVGAPDHTPDTLPEGNLSD
jgi:predicted CXXCH cytochrome family protein